MPLIPDTTLQHRYRLVRTIGSGGMGTVYLAEDQRLGGRLCAVKEHRPDPSLDAADLAKLRRQFEQREARILAELDHPNLPKVFDYFTEDGNDYLVMEYVAGDNLQAELVRHLKEHGRPLPEKVVLIWADQVLDALHYLHARPTGAIIHRDIKPANIILTDAGRIKLVDFGLAKLLTPVQGAISQSMQLGTLDYAPPEQFSAALGPTDERSDIFSLGATLYHLLTGTPPPAALERAMGAAVMAPARELCADVSAATSEALMRACALKKEERFGTVGGMKNALAASSGTVTGTSQMPRVEVNAMMHPDAVGPLTHQIARSASTKKDAARSVLLQFDDGVSRVGVRNAIRQLQRVTQGSRLWWSWVGANAVAFPLAGILGGLILWSGISGQLTQISESHDLNDIPALLTAPLLFPVAWIVACATIAIIQGFVLRRLIDRTKTYVFLTICGWVIGPVATGLLALGVMAFYAGSSGDRPIIDILAFIHLLTMIAAWVSLLILPVLIPSAFQWLVLRKKISQPVRWLVINPLAIVETLFFVITLSGFGPLTQVLFSTPDFLLRAVIPRLVAVFAFHFTFSLSVGGLTYGLLTGICLFNREDRTSWRAIAIANVLLIATAVAMLLKPGSGGTPVGLPVNPIVVPTTPTAVSSSALGDGITFISIGKRVEPSADKISCRTIDVNDYVRGQEEVCTDGSLSYMMNEGRSVRRAARLHPKSSVLQIGGVL